MRPALPKPPISLPEVPLAPPVSAVLTQTLGVAPAPDATTRMPVRRFPPTQGSAPEHPAARNPDSPPEVVSNPPPKDIPTTAFQREPTQKGPVAPDPVTSLAPGLADAPQFNAATALHWTLPAQPHTTEAALGPAVIAPDRASHALPKGFSTNLARAMGDTGHSRAELILEPAELGRVRFDMVTTGDRIQINLSVERPETLTLMRNHAEELRQEFRDAGFAGGTLNFSQWGQQGEGKARPEWAQEAAVPQDLMSAPADAPPTPRTRTPADGLDIRL